MKLVILQSRRVINEGLCLAVSVIGFAAFFWMQMKSAQGQLIDSKEVRMEAAAQKLAFGAVAGNFASSLDMQEAADFLLTPALVEQEAISDAVVITYPME
jgi:hypothetical protein